MSYYYYKTESGRIYQSQSLDCGSLNWQPLKKSAGATAYREQCCADLVNDFGLIDGISWRVYANVTRVSVSGMSRTIEFYLITPDNNGGHYLARITHLVAGAQNYPLTRNGLRISGCGMDMIFAALDGLCGIPANDLDIRSL
jgi:hypothetical protein